MQIECYLGVPLLSSSGKPIGLIVVLHDCVLEEVFNAKWILSVFAQRTAAELERQYATDALIELNQTLEFLTEADGLR